VEEEDQEEEEEEEREHFADEVASGVPTPRVWSQAE